MRLAPKFERGAQALMSPPPETDCAVEIPAPPDYGTVKAVLVNTSAKVSAILQKLDRNEGWIGFDTEVAGPQLRGRDFVNIGHSALLGLSLAFEDGKAYYVPVRHKGNNVSFRQLTSIYQKLLGNRLWAHNAKFDHQVMIRAGMPLPFLFDSMIAAWLVTGENWGLGLKDQAALILNRQSPPYDPAMSSKTGDQIKVYACHDAVNTLELGLHYYNRMTEGEQAWFDRECRFTRQLAEMKLQGFRLDFPGLAVIEDSARAEQAKLQHTWNELCPDVSMTSSKQLQELFIEGIWTPKGKTAGGAFDTGKKAIEWNVKNGKGDGPRLARIRLAHQEVAKIVSTYTEGLEEEARQWADNKIHPDLFHFGTVTGRLASAHPNIQNMPAHGSWAKLVRECFIPDEGMEFTSADYSQVELRYFADYCGGSIRQMFLDGEDLHQRTSNAMGISRNQAKTVNFGFLLYGGGPETMATGLGCSEAEAKEKIKALHDEYPEVEAWRQQVIDVVSKRAPVPYAKTLAGRIRHFPELDPALLKRIRPADHAALEKKYIGNCRRKGTKPTPKGLWYSIRSRGERLVVNYLIQGGARDLLVIGMCEYERHPDKTDDMIIVTTVHDEVLTQHLIGNKWAGVVLKEALESAGEHLGLTVPIIAEPKTGSNWSEVK